MKDDWLHYGRCGGEVRDVKAVGFEYGRCGGEVRDVKGFWFFGFDL